MRRVLMFNDHDKPAHMRVNEWLKNHLEVKLVDIKPTVFPNGRAVIFAIVDVPEMSAEKVEKM